MVLFLVCVIRFVGFVRFVVFLHFRVACGFWYFGILWFWFVGGVGLWDLFGCSAGLVILCCFRYRFYAVLLRFRGFWYFLVLPGTSWYFGVLVVLVMFGVGII